jgi:DNA polymerase III epsilon subunit family exonuclease
MYYHDNEIITGSKNMASHNTNTTFISLDLETTGFDPATDKIIEFGAIKFDMNGQKESLTFLINPGVTLPQIVTHITNITDTDLKTAPTFDTKIKEIIAFIGDLPIVGHNIQFDMGFLAHNSIDIKNELYDTQQLSSIFLPYMPSYSLEILTQKLNLPHAEKHRALDDAVAAMELFLKLAEEFKNLDPNLAEKIKTLSQKSNWPIKNLLSKLETDKKSKNASIPKPLQSKSTQANIQKSNDSTCQQLLTFKTSALFEIDPPYTKLIQDLAENSSKDTYISLPGKLFRKIHTELPDTLSKIDIQKNYISLKRLKHLEEKPFFEDYEIKSLLKYLVWLQTTKTGLLSEVTLFNEEKVIINQVNINESIENPMDEYFFRKALEKDVSCPAICTHDFIIEHKLKDINLVIFDFINFLQTLEFHSSIYLKLETFLLPLKALQEIHQENHSIQSLTSKSTILFGIFGMIFEKFNDRNPFSANATINEEIIASKEWADAKSLTINLIEISKELGEIVSEKTSPHLKQWKNNLKLLDSLQSLKDMGNSLMWIEKDFKGDIVFRLIPISTRENMKSLLGNCKNFKIINETVDLNDDGKFIKTLSGLEEKLPIHKLSKKAENLNILITDDINEKDNTQLPNFLINYIKTNNEKVAIVFTSKQQIEFFTLKLSQAKIPMASQIAASIGKLQEQFKHLPQNSALLITPNTWENLETIEDIDTLFVHKLPFDPPSNPSLIALSKNYENPFEELQIPRTIITLKRLINRLKEDKSKSRKAIILDPRLLEKGYGQKFISALKEIAPVNTMRIF